MEFDISQILIIIGFIIYMIYSIKSGLQKYNQGGDGNIPPYGEPGKKPFNEEQENTGKEPQQTPQQDQKPDTYREHEYWEQKADEVVEAKDFRDEEETAKPYNKEKSTYRDQDYWQKNRKPSREKQETEYQPAESQPPETTSAKKVAKDDQDTDTEYTHEDYNKASDIENFFEKRRREIRAHMKEKIEDKDVKDDSLLKEVEETGIKQTPKSYKGYPSKRSYYRSKLKNKSSFKDAFVLSEILKQKYEV